MNTKNEQQNNSENQNQNLSQEQRRDRLLASHLFFDFSWKRWQAYEKILSFCDPFKTPLFAPWPDLPFTYPRSIEEAILYSEKKYPKNHPITRISILDENYPLSLRALPSPPPLLYLQGNACIPQEKELVAIVGTRKASAFGIRNASECSRFFVEKNLGIVSGLARGIDTIAHSECLRNNGYTLAILGCGFPRIYPAENIELADKIIASGGTLLSQFAPHTSPLPHYFPRRNILIAALSAGTIVIEGSPKSGALITGQAALDLSSPAIVLTQDFRSASGQGAIQLLRNGAIPVATFMEALEAISLKFGGYSKEQSNTTIPAMDSLFEEKETEEGTNPFLGREFTLEEFCEYFQYSNNQALIILEQLKLENKIRECFSQIYYFL